MYIQPFLFDFEFSAYFVFKHSPQAAQLFRKGAGYAYEYFVSYYTFLILKMCVHKPHVTSLLIRVFV